MVLSYLIFFVAKFLIQAALLIAVALGLFCLYILKVRWSYRHLTGPPTENFLFGHMLVLKRNAINQHELWLRWGRQYGPVYRVFVLHQVLVVLCDQKQIKEACLDSETYPKSKLIYGQLATMCGERCMGSSILVAIDHKNWKTKRLGLNPAFQLNYLKELTQTFSASADELVEKLNEVADGRTPVNMLDYFGRLGIDVICSVGFGFYPHTMQNDESPFPSAAYGMLKILSECFHDPFLSYGLNPMKRKAYNYGATSLKFVRNAGREIIRKRLAAIEAGEDTGKDILNILLSNLGHDLSEEALIDEFVTFFIAGQETTANSLAFLFMLLGKHPEAMKRIYKEVDDLTARVPNPDYEDIKSLEYVLAAWKESLRYFPPANGSARENKSDIILAGQEIPAGTVLFTDFMGAQRLCTSDGDSFRPERFLPEANAEEVCYMPFSIGQRSCIGRNFAQMEAVIIIYKILANFEFELIPEQSFDVEQALTLRLVDGAQVRLRRRDISTN